MNLKILFMILGYYTMIGLFFALAGNSITDTGTNYTNPLNESSLTNEEVDTGGIFGTGISFSRWFALVTIGIGLPDDTPDWVSIFFNTWQILFLLFSIGFIIASIWNG